MRVVDEEVKLRDQEDKIAFQQEDFEDVLRQGN